MVSFIVLLIGHSSVRGETTSVTAERWHATYTVFSKYSADTDQLRNTTGDY